MIDTLIQVANVICSAASPERLSTLKRQSLGKSLARLHNSINRIIETGKLIIGKGKKGKPSHSYVELSKLEDHLMVLTDTFHELQSPELSAVLKIYLPVAEKNILFFMHQKKNTINLLLSSLYGFTDDATALKEIEDCWREVLLKYEDEEMVNRKLVGNYPSPDNYDRIFHASNLRDLIDQIHTSADLQKGRRHIGDPVVELVATEVHTKKALQTIERLSDANSMLRKFIIDNFEPHEIF